MRTSHSAVADSENNGTEKIREGSEKQVVQTNEKAAADEWKSAYPIGQKTPDENKAEQLKNQERIAEHSPAGQRRGALPATAKRTDAVT